MLAFRLQNLRRLASSVMVLVAMALLAPVLPEAAAETKSERAFQIIVHPKNPSAALARDFVAHAFLKRTTRWPDDVAIKPVDLHPDSAVRKDFSRTVLSRSVAAVRNYWRQRLFSGRDVPPPELDSDTAVARYVAKHEGAIGYVTAGSEFADVKIVIVR